MNDENLLTRIEQIFILGALRRLIWDKTVITDDDRTTLKIINRTIGGTYRDDSNPTPILGRDPIPEADLQD